MRRGDRFPPRIVAAFVGLPIATVVAASMMVLGIRGLAGAAKTKGSFWHGDAGQLLTFCMPFAAGSVLFSIGVGPIVRRSLVALKDGGQLVHWMGVTFVVWGATLAAIGGGCLLGALHAILCGVVLHHATRSHWMAWLPAANLFPAWALALSMGDFSGHFSGVITSTEAIGAWNVLMSIEAAVWAGVKRKMVPCPGECLECRYDRGGLADGTACPECGSAFPPAYI